MHPNLRKKLRPDGLAYWQGFKKEVKHNCSQMAQWPVMIGIVAPASGEKKSQLSLNVRFLIIHRELNTSQKQTTNF